MASERVQRSIDTIHVNIVCVAIQCNFIDQTFDFVFGLCTCVSYCAALGIPLFYPHGKSDPYSH